MLRQKAHVRIARGGAVARVVREHYLRDDIACGVRGCASCASLPGGADGAALDPLSQDVGAHRAVRGPHVIVPDTNILLRYNEVLEERGDDGAALFRDAVVLQTVLGEVQARSPAVHRKLRARLVRGDGAARVRGDARVCLFSNEHARATFVAERPGVSPNDRNDAAIRAAARWYAGHLAPLGVSVVLLTEDAANARLAREQAADGPPVHVMAMGEYVSGLCRAPATLSDAVLYAPEHASEDGAVYEEHWPQAACDAALRDSRVIRGVLRADARDRWSATVSATVGGRSVRVSISGRSDLNRAIEGDSVYVQLLPSSPERPLERKGEASNAAVETAVESTVETAVDVLDEPETPADAGGVRGRVVGVAQRSGRPLVAAIDRRTLVAGAGEQTLVAVPLDRRYPRVRVRTRNAAHVADQRVVVVVDGWGARSSAPHGRLVRALGAAGAQATETEALLLAHDVAHAPFTPAVLACLPPADYAFSAADEGAGRTDLTHLAIVSVDPPGCTDIDDALHARAIPGTDRVEIGVHIADVTHFVRAGTALDAEASARATTVYLVDRRVDMLPSRLGTDLCSLRAGAVRFAFSVLWELAPDGSVVAQRFLKSRIRSRAALTYDQAQSVLDAVNGGIEGGSEGVVNGGVSGGVSDIPNRHNDTITISGPNRCSPTPDPECKAPLAHLDTGEHRRVVEGLRLLAGVARRLRAARVAAGALTLASTEVRFTVPRLGDDDVTVSSETVNNGASGTTEIVNGGANGTSEMVNGGASGTTVTSNGTDVTPPESSPIDVVFKEMKEANAMVEEFMLLANCAVAARIYAHTPAAAILRRHPAPPAENFAALNRALAARGLPLLDASSSRALATSLDATGAAAAGDPFVDRLVRIMATRCMYQAQYVSSGAIADDAGFRHYGLAAAMYTHFTSPIRRYADVVAHRILAAAIHPAASVPQSGGVAHTAPSAPDNYEPAAASTLGSDALDDLCANINYRHRMAQHAQRASTEFYTLLYFRARPPVVQDAYVVRIAPTLVGVLLPAFGVEGTVRWSAASAARAGIEYDEEHSRLHRGGAHAITLFQRVTVRLCVRDDDATLRHRLVVEVLDPPLLVDMLAEGADERANPKEIAPRPKVPRAL